MRLYKPYAYQAYATDFVMDHEQSVLMLDVGMGKTVIVLSALLELMRMGMVTRPLVIAPKRVANHQWTSEAREWAHTASMRMVRVIGRSRERMSALRRPGDLYLINRENLPWLVRQYGSRWPFDCVVIDELSSFRNPDSARTKALAKVRPLFERIIGMTATPAPNGYLDLWSQMYLIDFGQRLGKSYEAYRDRYFAREEESSRFTCSESGRSEIESRISDICVSLRAEDYLQIPELLEPDARVELGEEAQEAYDVMEQDLLLPFASSSSMNISPGALVSKLQQASGGAVYDANGEVVRIHDHKLDALEDLIESANGHNCLVFYLFKHERDRILSRFDQAHELGEDADIDRWNRGEYPVLVAHPASMGHGLNLQKGGDVMVWFSIPWDLEWYLQANGRLHRQGQRSVTVAHRLVATGTIDEDIVRVLEDKRKGQDTLLRRLTARIDRAKGRKKAVQGE